MLAFHNDPAIKRKYLTRVLGHQKSDELFKGQYWQNGKGCAVGCTIHSGNHMAYETELGIPVAIARLEDCIFENLPNKKAKEWPVRLLSAIHVGADLSMVSSKFLHWLLVDPKDGVIRLAKKEKTKIAVQKVADLYQRRLNGELVSTLQWSAADAYAADAYAYADAADAYAAAAAADAYAAVDAYAAADAADAYADAADAYAAAAADAYAAAADAYAAAADAYAAKIDHYVIMSDKLIELLENEKPKETEPVVAKLQKIKVSA